MASYKALGMSLNGGMQKDINDSQTLGRAGGVPDMLANDRRKHLVEVSPHGRLTQEGFLLNTAAAHLASFIFVMDGEGNIDSANKRDVHHPSAFLAGGPVAAAGSWKVVYGAVVSIGHQSGHYMPPYDCTRQVLTELKRRGVDTCGIETNWTGGTSKQLEKYTKKNDRTIDRLGPKGIVNARF